MERKTIFEEFDVLGCHLHLNRHQGGDQLAEIVEQGVVRRVVDQAVKLDVRLGDVIRMVHAGLQLIAGCDNCLALLLRRAFGGEVGGARLDDEAKFDEIENMVQMQLA